MKKIIIGLCLLATVSLFGQTEEKAFSIGPTVGANHSFLVPYTSKFYPTWTAGLSCIYSPGEHWGVGGDLRFSKEGSKTSSVEGISDEIELYYLRIPVKGMYFFGDVADDFRPKITLGPSIGFLVDEKNTTWAPANKVDFGLNGSAGFNYRLMQDFWLNVDANYYQGLTRVRNATTERELNGSVGLQVGVLFGL